MKKFNKSFDEVFSYQNLFQAYKSCCNGVRWKGSVQQYESKSLTELSTVYHQLQEEKFPSGRFHKFDVMERGKIRHIQSVKIYERVVQRCLCNNCLVPALTPKFIYDNSACIKNKGVHFAYGRLKKHLQKCSQNDYILQFDFKKYFDSIPHDKLIYSLSKVIVDEKIMRLLSQFINDFEGDRGIGLGSQISQICALYYPSYIDHYFSTLPEVIAYARYMDDGYIIARDKEFLKRCKNKLVEIAENLGLTINKKKTVITRLNNKIVFLKTRVYLTPSGKVIMKPNKKNMSRNRRKLKILYQKVLAGEMTIEDFKQVKQTIIGTLSHFDCYFFRKEIENIGREFSNRTVL